MPLLAGKKNVGHNVGVEQRAGKPKRQAIAIALSVLRRGKKVKKSAVKFARVPAGKHGTPSWNPGSPSPEQVEKRATDPLWQYHRRQIGYGTQRSLTVDELQQRLVNSGEGRPRMDFYDVPSGHQVIHPSQHHTNHSNARNDPPEGMVKLPPHLVKHAAEPGHWREESSAYYTPSADEKLAASVSDLSDRPNYPIAFPRSPVFDFHGSGVGRPMHHAIFPLQDLVTYAAKGDSYRIWAASVLGGNRHAIPHLVALLRQRDNPAGWWGGWSDLHRRLEREQGDLQPHQVADRLRKIASATESESGDPLGHRQLSDNAHREARTYDNGMPTRSPWTEADRNWSGYLQLADHMEESGLPQYAALVRSELANVVPDMQRKPRGNRRFSRRVRYAMGEQQRVSVPVRLAPRETSKSPSMWVISGPQHMENYHKFLSDAPEGVIGHLSAAHVEGGDGGATVLTSRTPMELTVPGGVPYSQHRVVRNVFLPHGSEVAPNVRGRSLAGIVGAGPDRVSWLEPHSTGAEQGYAGSNVLRHDFEVRHAPAGAFRPVSEEVEHTAPAATPREAWKPGNPFQFEPFSVEGEDLPEHLQTPPPVPTSPTNRPERAAPEPAAAAPAAKVKRVGRTANPRPLVTAKTPAALKKVEQQLLAEGGEGHRPEHVPLWQALAQGYAASGNLREARIAQDQSEFNGGSPVPIPENELRDHILPVGGSLGEMASALSQVDPNSNLAGYIRKNQVEINDALKKNDTHLSPKRAWLAAEAMHRITGDTLQLVRAGDRLLERLKSGTDSGDVPAFVRGAGSTASTDTLQRLDALKSTIHDWLNRQDAASSGSLQHGALGTTHHLADLAVAYAKARLGRHAEANRDAAGALAELGKRNDPVVNSAATSLSARVGEAARGVAHGAGLPPVAADSGQQATTGGSQYAFDRLRQVSDIIDPSNKQHNIYRASNYRDMFTGAPDQRVKQIAASPTATSDDLHAATVAAQRAQDDGAVSAVLKRDLDYLSKPKLLPGDYALLDSAMTTAAARSNGKVVDDLAERLVRDVQGLPPSEAVDAVNSSTHHALKSLVDRKMLDRAAGLSRGLYETIAMGRTPEQVLTVDLARPQQPKVRMDTAEAMLGLAQGMLASGDRALGQQIIDAAEPVVTGTKSPSPIAYSKLVTSYVRALAATRNEPLIDSRIRHLLHNMQPMANGSSEKNHFSGQHYRVLEEAIRAIVGEGYDTGEFGRRWADREELAVRKRIRNKVQSAIAAEGLGPQQMGRRLAQRFARRKYARVKPVSGWLSPSGIYHKTYDHFGWMRDNGKLHGLTDWSVSESRPLDNDVYGEAFKNGWHRLNYDPDGTIYTENPDKTLNNKQMETLQHLAAENGHDTVLGGFSGKQVLWSDRDRMSRRKKKRKGGGGLRWKNTVMPSWMVNQSSGGGCQQMARTGPSMDLQDAASALLAELRVVDQQVLARIRSGRVVPKNLLLMAANLREQLQELDVDTTLLPVAYQRRYGASMFGGAETAAPQTTPANFRLWKTNPQVITPVSRFPPAEPMSDQQLQKRLAQEVQDIHESRKFSPGLKQSVFVRLDQEGRPTHVFSSFERHRGVKWKNGTQDVLHSTWEGGKQAEGGHAMPLKRGGAARRYAAEEPWNEDRSYLDASHRTVMDPQGVPAAHTSPYHLTEDQRGKRDAPFNRSQHQGDEAAIRERKGVQRALISHSMVPGNAPIPVRHPVYGLPAMQAHVEALANTIRKNPNHPAVLDYVREAGKAGDLRSDFEVGEMARAAGNVLKLAKSDPANRHLDEFGKLAAAHDAKNPPVPGGLQEMPVQPQGSPWMQTVGGAGARTMHGNYPTLSAEEDLPFESASYPPHPQADLAEGDIPEAPEIPTAEEAADEGVPWAAPERIHDAMVAAPRPIDVLPSESRKVRQPKQWLGESGEEKPVKEVKPGVVHLTPGQTTKAKASLRGFMQHLHDLGFEESDALRHMTSPTAPLTETYSPTYLRKKWREFEKEMRSKRQMRRKFRRVYQRLHAMHAKV